MSTGRVGSALARGAAFIAGAQCADGSFEHFSSPTKQPFRAAQTYKTTFMPAVMLAALSYLPPGAISPVREKLAAWLLGQKSPHWSFNYWAADEPSKKTSPYPDDLDDTFCALIALYRHNPQHIDETCLGKVVKLLVATESQVGGPYRTWLVGKDAPRPWLDTDLAVNCNIAAFLGMVAEPLSNLNRMMEQAITTGKLTSPYYPSPYPIAYYLARAYTGPARDMLARQLLKRRRQGVWPTPLSNALAVSALVQLGRKDACQPAVEYLIRQQQPDGSWPAEAFCLDPMQRGRTFFAGAPALTTALALEALARYDHTPATQSTPKAKTANPRYLRIIARARAQLGALDTVLSRSALQVLEQVDARDAAHEITLLPSLFAQDLLAPPTAANTPFERLGLANLYGWMAYTVYDDFLDNEGDPKLLSAANVCLRYSLAWFRQALPKHAAFQTFVARTFDTIDAANAWEARHCRCEIKGDTVRFDKLPDYGNRERLAERSIGHALSPLGILVAAGHTLDGAAATSLMQAFRQYLIARQLNDDLHDWEADLQHGLMTHVTTNIVHELGIKPGAHQLAELLPIMRQQFWHRTLLTVCDTITDHTASARKALTASQLLTKPNILDRLLDGIDASVARTRQEQAKAEDFLTAFTS